MSHCDADSLKVFARDGLSADILNESNLHLAIGMFDGLHSGHIAVLGRAIKAARQDGGLSGVFTFDPHPSKVFRPDMATRLIMPLERRIRRMHEEGIDFVLVKSFDKHFGSMEAGDFVPFLIGELPSLKSIHVGENFRFGSGRSGSVDTLKESTVELDLSLEVVRREHHGQDPISSSRIRRELAEGNVRSVNLMLGRCYVAEGPVVPGKGLGRTMAFPTLNIHWDPEARPRFGVYLVALKTHDDSAPVPGIANYGLRPTVDDTTDPLLEVHLLEDGALPAQGELVRVAMLDFVREEQNFPSIDTLKLQIAADVDVALKAFSEEKSFPIAF